MLSIWKTKKLYTHIYITSVEANLKVLWARKPNLNRITKIGKDYLWLRNSQMNLCHGMSFLVKLNTGGASEVNKTPRNTKAQPIYMWCSCWWPVRLLDHKPKKNQQHWEPETLSRIERGRFGALKFDSNHHFFRNVCTKSGSLRLSQFSGCWLILPVYILMSFDFPFVRLFGVR